MHSDPRRLPLIPFGGRDHTNTISRITAHRCVFTEKRSVLGKAVKGNLPRNIEVLSTNKLEVKVFLKKSNQAVLGTSITDIAQQGLNGFERTLKRAFRFLISSLISGKKHSIVSLKVI
eukprot:jgi/Bigna1/136833/aug1.36_g11541